MTDKFRCPNKCLTCIYAQKSGDDTWEISYPDCIARRSDYIKCLSQDFESDICKALTGGCPVWSEK